MVWVMDSEEAKCFTDFSFLVCVQSVVFGELRGAFRRCAGFRRGGATLWRLQKRQK
jgi:hypothetical protein